MKQYIESKGYAVGCYSNEIDKLSKNAHKNLKQSFQVLILDYLLKT